MKNFFRKSVYIVTAASLFITIISCEKDFTDVESNVITNTKFNTAATSVDVIAENSPLESIQSDNISRPLAQYLLGVYASPDYEKIEASVVSQISIPTSLNVLEGVNYGSDTTTVVTKIDTVFLKLPYQVTLQANNKYKIDSIFGDKSKPFKLNVYRSNTFINFYNPADPSKVNSYQSNAVFEKMGSALNTQIDFPFIPSENDTMVVIKRRLYDDSLADNDTLKLFNAVTSTVPIPFARIPLDKDKFKTLFLDKYETGEFASQNVFNEYFRGLIIEATGDEGSLTSFNFNNRNIDLIPSLEIYYTNTVLELGTTKVLDTISRNNSFPLSGFKINTFKMEDKVYPVNNEIIVQGTAGSEGTITLFDQSKIDELAANNWLINDATLTFYINQSADTTHVPDRLYLYKSDKNVSNPSFTQITDATTEAAFGGIGGFLSRDATGKKEKYTFKLTDYISNILNGETKYESILKLKAYNPSDPPGSGGDLVFRNNSWNPKAVTLFNDAPQNGVKKAVLLISYSEKN
ncbi:MULTISPECIES: DUF4270 domain-containing protein [unclassified Polaribacter]|uniref:DUF4270 domain-containing protein n=1 Tax=unclassified Polaribacter TaxID=196858 RepID=UPI0011BFD942|nr:MULTISPECIES: DUF4270 domain-containing protein [unclassified Polaribacter]TXD50562.1 DUF4270 domain-containing protein [Polaribacter sp. IC063]TXD62017.1 DUF4270 domain-containing protein [Polaribacter sp. IC066]